MRSPFWNDNECSVGWTCFTAILTQQDIDWIKEMQPVGYFTPTFYQERRGDVFDETTNRFTKEGDERGFYYSFPEDKNGQVLLTAMRLRGMTGERFKSRKDGGIER